MRRGGLNGLGKPSGDAASPCHRLASTLTHITLTAAERSRRPWDGHLRDHRVRADRRTES